jgi:hypothetical protein
MLGPNEQLLAAERIGPAFAAEANDSSEQKLRSGPPPTRFSLRRRTDFRPSLQVETSSKKTSGTIRFSLDMADHIM